MFKYTVKTAIDINAPAELIWNILTDLESYCEWNPMIREASGKLKKGARIKVNFNPPGTKGVTFNPRLMVVSPNRELRWKGQPGIPLIFESEHSFIIESAGDGSVRLAHDMDFYGLAVPLARRKLNRAVTRPFQLMNEALKERAEHQK